MSLAGDAVPTGQRLFDLLPLVHRLRDDEHGHVLRELMDVLGDQVDVLSEELDQLYDDQFIETCARWVAPYVGDLIGYRPLHGVAPEVASPRAEVANTIAYRRRKGTAAVLEQLAHDVTGWPGARAVEFFERLVTTQYLNHVRLHALATPDLRDHESLGWARADDGQHGAFDDLAHSADVRRIDAVRPGTRGRHNIPHVGIFLWRIQPVRVTRSPLVDDGDGRRFRVDALGTDAPLFSLPRTEESITHLAEPPDVPLALPRRWLRDHLGDAYGSGRSLLLERQPGAADPVPVPVAQVRICHLGDLPGGGGAWAHEPPPGVVAVDPVLGRVWLGTAPAAGERLLATSHAGLAVPIGAGAATRVAEVRPEPRLRATDGEDLQPHLDALAAGGTLEIGDSDVYAQSLTIRATTAAAGGSDTEVHVVAADQARPSLVAATAFRLDQEPRTTVVLDGLLLSGGPLVLEEVGDAETRTVVLRNCTLVPGHARTTDGQPRHPDRASLLVLDPFAHVVVERCVLGPVVAVEGARVTVVDSAIDAGERTAVAVCGRAVAGGALRAVSTVADMVVGDGTVPAGDVDLRETTVVGGVHATRLDASNTILLAALDAGDPRLAAVWARRRQTGCVRHSWLPEASRTGRRYRCQPDTDQPPDVRRATRPFFTSLRFGDPAYLQLSVTTPDAVRHGADDEGEIGATHLLHTPQREANLRLRLEEYLRFGLEAGAFYAT